MRATGTPVLQVNVEPTREVMEYASVSTTEFLDDAQCQLALATVYELKAFWQSHEAAGGTLPAGVPWNHPFFTLGTPCYIGAKTHNKEDGYFAPAQEKNPVMKKAFSWFYDALREKIELVLGEPATFAEDAAVPGFHIFPTRPGVDYPGSGMHQDIQYKMLPWRSPQAVDFKNPISFTVPLELPEQGGGLNIYNGPLADILLAPEDTRAAIFESARAYVPYRCGTMVLQEGHCFHEVAGRRNDRTAVNRVTLQGHGLKRGNVWELYW
jgi:hypothetical protein